jgi:hypothetical protein
MHFDGGRENLVSDRVDFGFDQHAQTISKSRAFGEMG